MESRPRGEPGGPPAGSIGRVSTTPTPTHPRTPILDVELRGGRWDGHLKRVRPGAPPPSLRMVLRAELPDPARGEQWPTTSVYRYDPDGPRPTYRHSHDE